MTVAFTWSETATTVEAAAGDRPATLTGLAVPFGRPSGPASDGQRYQFDGPPANADELVDVVREHERNAIAGRLSEPWGVAEDGMTAVARLFGTSIGRDAAVEASEGVRSAFSIGATVTKFTEVAGVIHVAAGDWLADHLGVVRKPAFTEAAGVLVNHSSREEPQVTTTTTTEQTQVVELPTVAELAAQVAEHINATKAAPVHPLSEFATFNAYCEAFFTKAADDIDRQETLKAAFAVADQTTADNPGMMPPAWRTAIALNLDKRQPLISALGRSPIDGLTINWPYLDPATNLDDIIKRQTADKDELSGVKVKFLKGSAGVQTAGAVSDISYQLLKLSTPNYLAAYMQVLAAAYARYEEALAEGFAIAQGADAGALPDLSTPAKFKAWLFAASADVEDATGAAADIVLVDRATFVKLGGLEFKNNETPGNGSSAKTLTINVDGLSIKRAPFLAANQAIVTNGDSAKFPSTGVMTATAEDVKKLGRDVATWGMTGDKLETHFPAGIRVYGKTS